LREALYSCFLITAAYLFLSEKHGLISGLIFLFYLIVATFLSKNQFLLTNLPSIVVLYLSYIVILNYFYRYLNHTLIKVNVDSKVIKKQNEELTTINEELNETQRQINAQHEEVLSLSESVSSQNKILEEQNAKLEESMQQKSKLFSIIAHDIKSPLSSIASLTELMIEKYDELPDERKKIYLTKMLSSNKLLQSLLENLLTWSRSQTGLIQIKPEKIELKDTIEKIIAIYKNYASNKSLQLIREIDDNIYVIADRMMIETILRNLISNAIKYSFEHGVVSIHVEKQGMYIKVTIKDYGIGIDKERINTLFSYSNGIITLGTQGEKGTGLGLRICKEFIEKLNGKIWIESESNLGTTINFILPYKDK
jgi:signal transduction histidine kinase